MDVPNVAAPSSAPVPAAHAAAGAADSDPRSSAASGQPAPDAFAGLLAQGYAAGDAALDDPVAGLAGQARGKGIQKTKDEDPAPVNAAATPPDPAVSVILAAISYAAPVPPQVAPQEKASGNEAGSSLSAGGKAAVELTSGVSGPAAAQGMNPQNAVTSSALEDARALQAAADAHRGEVAGAAPAPHAHPGSEGLSAPQLPASAAAAAEIHTPVHSPSWGAELGQKLLWMANDKLQVASMQLNPPDLGPVQIVLHLSGDSGTQASVAIASPHADVRNAVEAAVPRLREMLADAGIQLGQFTVGAESFGNAGRETPAGWQPAQPEAASVEPVAAALPRVRTGAGLVDVFA